MLRDFKSKPHKTYIISQKYTFFWKKKKYPEGRNCCRKKKLRKLRDFCRNIFFPQIFLPATISAFKVFIAIYKN